MEGADEDGVVELTEACEQLVSLIASYGPPLFLSLPLFSQAEGEMGARVFCAKGAPVAEDSSPPARGAAGWGLGAQQSDVGFGLRELATDFRRIFSISPCVTRTKPGGGM